jgi:Flp pilus assembly CpaE family ATPase
MRRANNVYLVTTGTFASAANAQSVVEWLHQHNPHAIVSQIYNKVAPDQPISAEQMEQVTGLKNKLVIPYNKKLAADLAQATSLSKSSHTMFSTFEFLVADIRGQGAKATERNWFSRLFG